MVQYLAILLVLIKPHHQICKCSLLGRRRHHPPSRGFVHHVDYYSWSTCLRTLHRHPLPSKFSFRCRRQLFARGVFPSGRDALFLYALDARHYPSTMPVSIFEGCGDGCGWTAGLLAGICFGTFGVPLKSPVTAEADPLVLQVRFVVNAVDSTGLRND